MARANRTGCCNHRADCDCAHCTKWHGGKKARVTPTAELIPYTPTEWTVSQLAMHCADTMEQAWNNAACLAGGWYRRPVTIDYQVTADNNERYMIRPSDAPVVTGWTPIYELKRVQA
jgi:hypothetical protein